MKILRLFCMLCTLGTVAFAQATLPTVQAYSLSSDDPFLDYKVSNCPGTLGFGLLTYGTLADAIRLSDICILEGQGTVISAESQSGLQLTKQSPQGRAYEILSTGNDEYSRVRVSLVPDENAPGCSKEPVESIEYVIPNASHIANMPNTGFAMLMGYTLPATSLRPKNRETEVLLGIRNISQGELGTKTISLGVNNAQGDMYGKATFSGEGGSLQISRGGGYTYGNSQGGLNFQFTDDGGFVAGGSFSAQSIRIAGHEPNEMVTIEGTIPYLRGHVLGSNGGQMLGYGLVKGSYRDAQGQTHQFRASAYLIACMN